MVNTENTIINQEYVADGAFDLVEKTDINQVDAYIYIITNCDESIEW